MIYSFILFPEPGLRLISIRSGRRMNRFANPVRSRMSVSRLEHFYRITKSFHKTSQKPNRKATYPSKTIPSSKPFLDKLKTAEKTYDLHVFHYLGKKERENAFELFNSDVFPWVKKPKLYGESLPQHAYNFQRGYESKRKIQNNKALSLLDNICVNIERDFDVKVYEVYCNRLDDPTHNIGWHKDTFGTHIFVLSLGSQRTVKFRENATGRVNSVRPKAGDMYFMPLGLNKTHQHRVCPGEPSDETRISFVFFVKTPNYAKEYKISRRDTIAGYLEDALSNPS